MWLFFGIVLGAGLLLFAMWLRGRGIRIAWYEWLLGVLGLALLLFAIQNYRASLAEFEPTAPGRFLLAFGLPAFLMLLLAVFLVWFRRYRAGKKIESESGAAEEPLPVTTE